jgi:hypothetical protein
VKTYLKTVSSNRLGADVAYPLPNREDLQKGADIDFEELNRDFQTIKNNHESMNFCNFYFGSKLWQAPLYGSFVNLAYLKDFNY